MNGFGPVGELVPFGDPIGSGALDLELLSCELAGIDYLPGPYQLTCVLVRQGGDPLEPSDVIDSNASYFLMY